MSLNVHKMSLFPDALMLRGEKATPDQKSPQKSSVDTEPLILTCQISFLNLGKCSHGGHFDSSSSQPPRGGINKDSTSSRFSPHHKLHPQAAEVALLASIEALSLLRSRLGDRGFSRWVALWRRVSCWVGAPAGTEELGPGDKCRTFTASLTWTAGCWISPPLPA